MLSSSHSNDDVFEFKRSIVFQEEKTLVGLRIHLLVTNVVEGKVVQCEGNLETSYIKQGLIEYCVRYKKVSETNPRI